MLPILTSNFSVSFRTLIAFDEAGELEDASLMSTSDLEWRSRPFINFPDRAVWLGDMLHRCTDILMYLINNVFPLGKFKYPLEVHVDVK